MKWRGFIVFFSLVVPLLASNVSTSLAGPIYQWTDEEGNVGFTDDPAKIPEKYRRSAILETTLPRASEEKDPAPSEPPFQSDVGPFPSDQETDDAGHDQLYWRERIGQLRSEQGDLIQKRMELEKEAGALGNPLTSSRIEQRRRFQEIQIELSELKQKIGDIENQITVVVPEEARKLNVPPGWLRE